MAEEKNENVEVLEETETSQNNNETSENTEIEKLKNELAVQKDLFLRIAAEYNNFRKRTEKDKALIYSDATANAVANILPIADSLEMAGKSLNEVPAEYKKGIEMVLEQLNSAFKKMSVEAFGTAGDTFNPDIHNAISHIDDESVGENIIVEVYQKGYKINDKIIRHAMVKVAN